MDEKRYAELTVQIKECEKEFIKFMKIETMPRYTVEFYNISLDEIEKKGYGAPARSKYDHSTGEHVLLVCENLPFMKYNIFHEFTHILDNEIYAKNDKIRYATLFGYSEYHAAQVELMLLIGAKNIEDNSVHFSLEDSVELYYGKRQIIDFLDSKYSFSMNLVREGGLTKSIEQVSTTLGVLYNYWGMRSICMLYAIDYKETADYKEIYSFIPKPIFSELNDLMSGWFDDKKIDAAMGKFGNIISALIRIYKLM